MNQRLFQVQSGSRVLPAAVRVSARARHVRLRVVPGLGLEVVVPKGCDPGLVPEIIRKEQGWIDAHSAAIERAATKADKSGILPARIQLKAVQKEVQVSYIRRSSRRPGVQASGPGRMTVCADPELEAETCLNLLQAWLKREARSSLEAWVQDLAEKHSFFVARVQVRRQKTRWGSMSSTGTMSLNCLLLFLNPCLVEAVILHELCHIRFPDHGPGFAALLTSLCPEWPELRAELRHGARAGVPIWAQVEL